MESISRQYSFICNKNGFTISVIEGNSLINNISKMHNIGPHALNFYRKTVLSSLQMVNFLKPGENLGFYIDSEEPFFRFKIELILIMVTALANMGVDTLSQTIRNRVRLSSNITVKKWTGSCKYSAETVSS